MKIDILQLNAVKVEWLTHCPMCDAHGCDSHHPVVQDANVLELLCGAASLSGQELILTPEWTRHTGYLIGVGHNNVAVVEDETRVIHLLGDNVCRAVE